MSTPVTRPAGQQSDVLSAALARARAAAPRGVAVFDLDSTLLDNRPRQARILQDYGRTVGVSELLEARPEHWKSWSIADALRELGLPPAEIELHVGPVRAFWRDWFFTSAYCRLDVPVPGAPEFVHEVLRAGATIAYVSGRGSGMRNGTCETFRQHGLPLPDGARVHLYLKPRPELHDDAWKLEAIAEVNRLGPVVLAFDNEPTHVNGYAEAWPEAMVVHLDRDHSERPVEVRAGIPKVVDFVRQPR